MLNSLYIKNFRNLKDLKIKSLERVNLIIGKNNTGKSTILEALALYSSEGSVETLIEQLENRGEFDKDNSEKIEDNLKSFASFFTDRKISFDDKDSVCIGVFDIEPLQLQIVRYRNEIQNIEGHGKITKKIILKKEEINHYDYEIGLNIKSNGSSNLISMFNFSKHFYLNLQENQKTNFQFINTKTIEKNQNSLLWDKIILTEKEEFIINALRIIEPKIDRLAFVEGYKNERFPVVKLQGEKQVLPLKSMGDGINRILTIILALVNAEGGMLLIDEFENGLHHTVQEQLWKMIFLLAEALDIQVFATTHSEDCIRGFENVLNDYNIGTNGKLIRLDRKGDKIVQVEFDKAELKVATDFGIEIR